MAHAGRFHLLAPGHIVQQAGRHQDIQVSLRLLAGDLQGVGQHAQHMVFIVRSVGHAGLHIAQQHLVHGFGHGWLLT